MDKDFWRGYYDALSGDNDCVNDEDWDNAFYRAGYAEGIKFFMPH